jgi:hypothetical protein
MEYEPRCSMRVGGLEDRLTDKYDEFNGRFSKFFQNTLKKIPFPTILPEKGCESLSETLQYIYPDALCQMKLSYNNSS